jgi:hypothetical protein
MLPTMAALIKRDFVSIDRIETYTMSNDVDGRFDVIVVGSGRTPGQGWRVEVLSIDHATIKKRWDSQPFAKAIEFENSGPRAVHVYPNGADYELVIETCAQHECSDGISDFLIFLGKKGHTFKAKLVTEGLDRPTKSPPRYNVTFSPNIPENAKKILERAICNSDALSNKAGLPFACKNE